MNYSGDKNHNLVLYVEDDLADRIAFEHGANRSGYPFTFDIVASYNEALVSISKNAYQAVVSDYNLGDSKATDLFPYLKDIPLIIITGGGSEEIAVNALKAGAFDYLIKDIAHNYLKLLPITVAKAIDYKIQKDELERYRTMLEFLVRERTNELTEMYRQLQESEANFRNIFDNTSDGFVITDFDFNFLEANQTLLNQFGVTKEYLAEQKLIDFLPETYHKLIFNKLLQLKLGASSGDMEIEVISPLTQRVIPFEINNVPIVFNHRNAILTVMRDITERKSLSRRLVETIIQTEEKERSRIARDLHDEIGPMLSALKIYTTSFIESSSIVKKDKLAGQMGVIIRDVIESIKDISNDMSPHVLVNFGLSAAVQNISELFSKNLAIKVTSTIGTMRFSETVESVFYRIIKELINNTVKHAGANNIFISLEYKEPVILCHYRDDGIGFDLQNLNNPSLKGMGIGNIKSRIHSLGGDYEILTSPGNGFEVNLVLQTSPHDYPNQQ